MAYPASITFKHEETSSRWWALFTLFVVKIVALVPHFVILYILQLIAAIVQIIGIVATLINGRYPQWAENYIVGIARWGMRMFVFYTCMTDKYPPFTLKSVPDYPADLSFEHQETSSRLWALLTIIPVKIVLLIPHFVVLILIEFVASICMFLGIFATLFMGRYPQSFENVLVTFFRYAWRLGTYFTCMTDKYPPIGWKE